MQLVKSYNIDNIKGPGNKKKLYDKVLCDYNKYFNEPWEKEAMMNHIHYLRQGKKYHRDKKRESRANEKDELQVNNNSQIEDRDQYDQIDIAATSVKTRYDPIQQITVGNARITTPPLVYKKQLTKASIEKK